MNKIISLLLIALSLNLSGCGGGSSASNSNNNNVAGSTIAGTWNGSIAGGASYKLTFNADGTYTKTITGPASCTANGTYTVSGNLVTIPNESGACVGGGTTSYSNGALTTTTSLGTSSVTMDMGLTISGAQLISIANPSLVFSQSGTGTGGTGATGCTGSSANLSAPFNRTICLPFSPGYDSSQPGPVSPANTLNPITTTTIYNRSWVNVAAGEALAFMYYAETYGAGISETIIFGTTFTGVVVSSTTNFVQPCSVKGYNPKAWPLCSSYGIAVNRTSGTLSFASTPVASSALTSPIGVPQNGTMSGSFTFTPF